MQSCTMLMRLPNTPSSYKPILYACLHHSAMNVLFATHHSAGSLCLQHYESGLEGETARATAAGFVMTACVSTLVTQSERLCNGVHAHACLQQNHVVACSTAMSSWSPTSCLS